ncbi:MAG: type II toxin-antitoxin system RelE/ParE family toxin [Mariprofundaceae bacterium]|nr:type II toxin-antitoxin system RelE/ParE family toxin [Mariprofundaceae bacterium]
MKHYRVRLIRDAETDLNDIYTYIKQHDSLQRAADIVDALQSVCITLSQFPERGHVPQELATIDQMQYREIVHGPWRVIYQVDGNDVLIHAILDGRRDVQNLLAHRLTRP